ncbi:uncharacterized protein [Penaeus vannamei]|uniref:uncharacterized protein n=1 Tax=Penaeus vannamei TaxID=6689 RepID=UPI00387F601B
MTATSVIMELSSPAKRKKSGGEDLAGQAAVSARLPGGPWSQLSHRSVPTPTAYPGASEGEVQRRGAFQKRQRELRVLRASQDAAPPRRHHFPAGQGLYHQTDHLLPQATRIHTAWGPAVAARQLREQVIEIQSNVQPK